MGIELETLTSYDRLKLGSKKLDVYQALMQHVARDNSGLSLVRRKDATCFLRWIMSMMSDSTILACHQRASGSKTVERRVSTIILNVYQSTGIEKEDGSRLSLENHRKLDEVRRFFNKKFEEEHDVHRNLASSEQYSRPSEKGEYQYVSGVMGIAYNPFLDSETGGAHRNHEVAELLKFWTEKIMEIDAVEKERPSLGLILEKTPEVVSIPRSNMRVEVNMGDGNGLLITNLGVVWKLLRPSWCPHSHASLIEETTEWVRLAPTEDEDLAKLSVVHKLILPQMKESGEKTNSLESAKKMEPGSCLDSTCGSGEHTCDGRSCVRILSFQKKDLVTWFEDITEREKSEVQIVAECYARTTVNIATALGFFSRMCSLQSLERLESEHHLVTALSVESWPGVLQVARRSQSSFSSASDVFAENESTKSQADLSVSEMKLRSEKNLDGDQGWSAEAGPASETLVDPFDEGERTLIRPDFEPSEDLEREEVERTEEASERSEVEPREEVLFRGMSKSETKSHKWRREFSHPANTHSSLAKQSNNVTVFVR